MPKTKIIGITGGIATGKSTVSNWLKQKKYPVICADQIAHEVVKPERKAYKEIVKTFGTEVLKKNKTLNRSKLAKIVFSNPKLKRRLESVVHPQVHKTMLNLIKKHQKRGKRFIFLDIPLLFEKKREKLCDQVICVSAPKSAQIERLIKNKGMTRRHALDRICSQMPLREKEKKSDMVIKNNGTKRDLKRLVARILKDLKELKL